MHFSLNYASADGSSPRRRMVKRTGIAIMLLAVIATGVIGSGLMYLMRPRHPTENEVSNWLSQVHRGDSIQSVENFFQVRGISSGFVPYGKGPPEPLVGTVYSADHVFNMVIRFDANGHVSSTQLSVSNRGL